MKSRSNPIKGDDLWNRYWAIEEGHATGFCVPILWHLALGRDFSAMVTLGNTFPESGKISDSFSQSGLNYRAHRGGYAYAAQHLAMTAFNRRDLQEYRYWLRRAARFDPDAARQLKRFETRLPHQTARRIGRGRPYRRYDYE